MDSLHTNVNEDYQRFMDWFSWTYGSNACPLPRHLVEWKNLFPKYRETYQDPFYNWVTFDTPAQKAMTLDQIAARLFHHEPPVPSIPGDDSLSDASSSRSESSDSLSESRSLSTESCSSIEDPEPSFGNSGRRFDFDNTPSLSQSSDDYSESGYSEYLGECATELRTDLETNHVSDERTPQHYDLRDEIFSQPKEKQLWKKKPSVSNEMMTSDMTTSDMMTSEIMEDSLSEISQPFAEILPFAPLGPCRFQELSEKNKIGLRLKWKNYLDAPVGNTKYLVVNFVMEYYRGSHDLFAFHQKLKDILVPHDVIDFYRLITVEC